MSEKPATISRAKYSSSSTTAGNSDSSSSASSDYADSNYPTAGSGAISNLRPDPFSHMTFCKCGLLLRCANDPDVPIGFDRGKEEYFLEAAPGTRVKLSCCFSCGGDFGGEQLVPCKCNDLAKSGAMEKSPIRYDRTVGEYYIEYDSARLHFYYCPFCRGILPESSNDHLFMEPSPDEISSMNQKLLGVKSLAQVISMIGAPDERILRSADDIRDEVIYNVLPIKETLLYKSLLRTACLCVQETCEGRIMMSFLRKAKET